MSDLFHVDVPESYILQVFDVMRRAHWHEFRTFKQWGGVNKKKTGRELDGRTYDAMPRRAERGQGRRSLVVLERG